MAGHCCLKMTTECLEQGFLEKSSDLSERRVSLSRLFSGPSLSYEASWSSVTQQKYNHYANPNNIIVIFAYWIVIGPFSCIYLHTGVWLANHLKPFHYLVLLKVQYVIPEKLLIFKIIPNKHTPTLKQTKWMSLYHS